MVAGMTRNKKEVNKEEVDKEKVNKNNENEFEIYYHINEERLDDHGFGCQKRGYAEDFADY